LASVPIEPINGHAKFEFRRLLLPVPEIIQGIDVKNVEIKIKKQNVKKR